jgi:hypothetical protein
MKSHTGGCHCGAVRFRFDAPARVLAHECNCSICAKSGYLHLIVPAARFSLLSGSESLCEYRFGSGAARHLFCSRCGIKCLLVFGPLSGLVSLNPSSSFGSEPCNASTRCPARRSNVWGAS